jgi:uncharacterized coiled-coil protein SlyX
MSDDRLVHLEGRFEWLERHVVEQDKTILELTESVRHLRAELGRWRERAGGAADISSPDPIDERPPHY